MRHSRTIVSRYAVVQIAQSFAGHGPSRMLCNTIIAGLMSSAAMVPQSGGALAQSTSQAVTLPPVVIEGGTLAKPKVKPKSNQSAVDDSATATAPIKKTNSSAKKKSSTDDSAGAASAQQTGDTFGQSIDGDAAGIRSSTGQPAEAVGTSVSVVTAKELEGQQIRHAADALRSLPGVHVGTQGSFGSLTQVRIRGAEGNHTLVLIDGVEVNDPTDGEFDFSSLSADGIERIEVLRGPQSGIYGSKALGGVVNIVTRSERGPLTAVATAEYGAFNTRDISGRVSGGNERGYASVAYHRRATDGFNTAPQGDEDDGNRLSTFHVRAGATLIDGINVDFSLRNQRSVGDYDDFGGNPGRYSTAFDAPNTFDHNQWIGSGKLDWEMFGGALTHTVRASHTDIAREDRGLFSTSQNDSTATRYDYTGVLQLPDLAGGMFRHSVTGFVGHERETFTPNSDFGFFGVADGVTRERNAVAYAGEYRAEIAKRLFLSGVVRRDDHDTFDDFTTWRTSASLLLPEWRMRPHASYGTAVKLPTMFETFGSIPGTFKPNADLQPERSEGWDAGIEFTLVPKRALLDVTYFEADLTDKINGFAFDPVSGLFTAENLPGRSTRRGVELSARMVVAPGLGITLAYTYVDAEDPDGVVEIRRPPHTARADLSYSFDNGRGEATLGVVYTGTNYDRIFEQVDPFGQRLISLDQYWLVRVAASYELRPGLELFGRVENLLNQDYQEAFGYETAGIAAYAGVKIKFEAPLLRQDALK